MREKGGKISQKKISKKLLPKLLKSIISDDILLKYDIFERLILKDTLIYGGIAKWPNAADCKSVPSGSKVQILLPPFHWGIAKR